jgi:hypothetical protein
VIHQSRCTGEETKLEFLNLKGNYMLSNDTETPQGSYPEIIYKNKIQLPKWMLVGRFGLYKCICDGFDI